MNILKEIKTVYKSNKSSFFPMGCNDIDGYVQTAIDKRLILVLGNADGLTALVEMFRITKEQLERIEKGDFLLIDKEDVTSGDVFFVANLWIAKWLRNNIKFHKVLYNNIVKRFGEHNFMGLRKNKKILRWDKINGRYL